MASRSRPRPASPHRAEPSRLLTKRREESFAWGRLRWRLGRRSPRALTACPQRPIGAKLEITYACNLRCGFCYTDSPRHTLQRTPELSDEQWRAVAAECLDLGIVEAVLTGGEPFLRRELTLELIETLAGAGVGVTLNTNGWFVDEEIARRLGALSGVTAHVSLDGARPGLHDASRGVPGSWRRAVEGIDRLLRAGVGVCVVHVVTPGNAEAVGELLEQMWVLGVPWVRVTAVVVTGAAARGGEWKVSPERLREAAREFEGQREGMKVTVQAGTGGTIALQGLSAPGSFLVRPNGDVRPDSMRPFTFGNAIEDGLAASWEAIREGWGDERINIWAGSLRSARDLPDAELIPYLDSEAPIAGSAAAVPGGRDLAVPEPTPPRPVDPADDSAAAREKLRGLALARRYRRLPLRWSGSPEQRFIRLVGDGTYLRLNGTAALVMDALDEGTAGEAIEQLDSRFAIGRERATADVLATVRALQRSRVIVAANASHALATEPGTSDLPDLEPGA